MATFPSVELHRTEIGGVPCFWVDSGRPTLAAELVFRHGTADEPAHEAGWQHLIEHMCLDDNPGHAGVDINGSVGLLETTFTAHGEPSAVADHIQAVAQWLSAPSLDALDHSRAVLRAEAETRDVGPVGRALSWRYGARGPGIAGIGELGLGRAEPHLLDARIASAFTRGNAALALDGPPPARLALELRDGIHQPLVPASPLEDEPAAYADGPGLTLSGVVKREGGMFVGVNVVERALTEHLRHGSGAAYSPWSQYIPVDHDHAVVILGSDIQADRWPGTVEETLGLIEGLLTDGVPEEWLAEVVARITRAMRDPYAVGAIAFAAARRHLHRHEPEELEQMVARVQAVTTEDVRAGLVDLTGTLLVCGPTDALGDLPLPTLSFPTTDPEPAGAVYRHVNWPVVTDVLKLSRGTVELTTDAGTRAVAVEELAGYLTYEDGTRHLLRTDGYGITVAPAAWNDGKSVVSALDRSIPTHLHLPQPGSGEPIVERLAWPKRWAFAAMASKVWAVPFMMMFTVPSFLAGTLLLNDRGLASNLIQSTLTGAAISSICVWEARRRDASPPGNK